ncbi:DUF3987 domain-containing protein [Pseudomonas aeruginosa]|uniref:DUF3987 domain-containing protein n=1 Tax=Pseudomonas aeruginosa TaxID=287 RepID=UPI0026F29475|nr:DUF3987 domain-containing protein [Pseudomonas aeruginosa]
MDKQTLGQPSWKMQDNPQYAQYGAQPAQQQGQGVSMDSGPISAPAAPQPEHRATTPAISWPPGNLGRIAQFIYTSALRPVPEVAIAGALGLIAGICGRQWNTNTDSGLNLYINLVARSAIGKEAMHDGVATLQSAMLTKCPTIGEVASFKSFASGPALVKALDDNPCFVNMHGELGKTLQRMAFDKDGVHTTLRTEWTKLYSKSGRRSVAGGIAYSSQENNATLSTSVAYSVVGETTPVTFYSCLTSSMMEDGFMSRFLTIEYAGDRPPRNRQPKTAPDEELIQLLVAMATQAEQLALSTQWCIVQLIPSAQHIYDEFEDECDEAINAAGDDESRRQVWNRAALKMLRIACLAAVADNHLNPQVTQEHIQWALGLVKRNNELFLTRIDSGDIGTDDHAREQKVLEVCRRFLTQEKVAERYEKSFESLRRSAIVPRAYLQTMTQKLTQFSGHKLGATSALDLTLRSLIAAGHLMEVDKSKVIEGYNYHGTAYRVLRFDFSKQNDDFAVSTKFWPD